MTSRWIDAQGTMHENCQLLFFVGRRCLGQTPYDPGAHPELRYRRSGIAYFCNDCGEIWGRIVCQPDEGRCYDFDVVEVLCERHANERNHTCGSFLEGRNDGLLDLLPPAALEREALLHLKETQQ